jgi:hypothetical protein
MEFYNNVSIFWKIEEKVFYDFYTNEEFDFIELSSMI